MVTKIECFCGKATVVAVVPWPEYAGVMAVDASGKPHCSAFEGEYPHQGTARGAQDVRRQVLVSTREGVARFYAKRRDHKRRRKILAVVP